jgi:hypothetical protein
MKAWKWLATTVGVGALSLAHGTTARADDYAALVESLRACGAVGANRERLVCYDQLLERLRRGESATVSPAVKEEVFGLQPAARAPEPRAAQASGDSAGAASAGASGDSISARVVRVQRAADGGLIIDLDNGQSWQELTAASMLLTAGDTVRISRGAFNSFRLLAPDGRFGRVKRIR